MSRFNLKFMSFAIKKAKEIKAVVEDRPLTACQRAYAVMIGYSDWNELKVVTSKHLPPSQLDEDIDTIEQGRRENYQTDRLVALWNIPAEEALTLIRKIRPTASVAASGHNDHAKTPDSRVLSDKDRQDESAGSIMDEIYAAIREPIIIKEKVRLLAEAEKMPTRTDEERLFKAIFVNMADKKIDVMKHGVGSEDYARRLNEIIRDFLGNCDDIKNPQKEWMEFRDMTFDLSRAGRSTDVHICHEAMDVLSKAFRSELGVEFKEESPEEWVIRRLLNGSR
ncbi:hypothetical protein [Acetobacter okinawensis]|uniref:hypothetical protein n=1 Tax=Acetobacter okinawensis TaxID=1076594 RepID=UPI00046FE793|nr:hypothetical protein [Acetobacter okinawensis]